MKTHYSKLTIFIAVICLVLTLQPGLSDEGPVLNDDGLYQQPWFLQSFMELNEDLVEAKSNGKRFAVMWELKGCPYCKETHFVNFANPEIKNFVKDNFEILQLNILGSKIVTDFDGMKLSERELAKKYGIRFTPTIQFFSEDPNILKNKNPREREVARAQGYLKSEYFLSFFKFVNSRSYEKMTFRMFLKKSS